MNAIVCLPTKNEVESIAIMIDEIRALGLEVFVCDEQSDDGTIERALGMGVEVIQRDKPGKGNGIQKAMRVAHDKGCEVLVLIDCDTTYPSARIPELLRHMAEFDMVVAARTMGDIVPLHRVANYLFTGAVNLAFGGMLSDVCSGMRAFRLSAFDGLLDAQRMNMETQLSCVALRQGLRVHEFPIRYGERKGDSKIRAWDSFEILLTIARERLRPQRV